MLAGTARRRHGSLLNMHTGAAPEQLALVFFFFLYKDTFLPAVSDVGQDTLSLPVTSQCHLEWLPSPVYTEGFLFPFSAGEKKLRDVCIITDNPLMSVCFLMGGQCRHCWSFNMFVIFPLPLRVKLGLLFFFFSFFFSPPKNFLSAPFFFYFFFCCRRDCWWAQGGKRGWLVAKTVSQSWPHSVFGTLCVRERAGSD